MKLTLSTIDADRLWSAQQRHSALRRKPIFLRSSTVRYKRIADENGYVNSSTIHTLIAIFTLCRAGFCCLDDILILVPSRWKLRGAIKQVNTELARLNLAQHLDKTFIGHITTRFDFLVYHFSPEGLTVAQATVERFIEKATRLCEQEQSDPNGQLLLGQYVRHWKGWVQDGLSSPSPGRGFFNSSRMSQPTTIIY